MKESQLDEAVQSHYDYLYRQYYETDEPERFCENCRHYGQYGDKCCSVLWDTLSKEEEATMMAQDDYSIVMKDPDDYCPEHEFEEE